MQGRIVNQGLTFGQLLNKYTEAIQRDRPLKKRPCSPPHHGNASPPRREFSRRRVDFPQFPPQQIYTMPWAQPASNAVNLVWEHEVIWLQCFPTPYPPPYQREEGSRMPVHDRLGPRKSGPAPRARPVRPVLEIGAICFSVVGILCEGEEARSAIKC